MLQDHTKYEYVLDIIDAIKITQVSHLEHFKQFSTPLPFFLRNSFIPEPRVKSFDIPEITIFGGSMERMETCHYFVGKTPFSRAQVLKSKLYIFFSKINKKFAAVRMSVG